MIAPGEWLDGVEVCTHEGELCTSAERGTYFLEGARPDSRFDLSFKKPGYVPSFVQVDVDKYDGYAEAGLLSVAAAQAVAEASGAPALGETGGVLVEMMEPGYGVPEAFSGVSFSVLGSDRARSVYADEHGMMNATLAKTSRAGWGAALGITPGTIEIEARYDAGGRRCGVWSTEVSDLVNPVKYEVRAGHFTVVTMLCLSASN
jgi:hypothetical protein